MKDKTVVILRGLGGNFKTSITDHFVNKGYIRIPEGSREFENYLYSYDKTSDSVVNSCVKRVLLKSMLEVPYDKFISDRGLIDNGLMNQFTKDCLVHYRHIYVDNFSTEDLYNQECSLLNGYKVINILLVTKDEKFIHKIIDESYDSRACFFDNTEWYLWCQAKYEEFILSHYHNVLKIELNDIPESDEEYSDEVAEYVNNVILKIEDFINN